MATTRSTTAKRPRRSNRTASTSAPTRTVPRATGPRDGPATADLIAQAVEASGFQPGDVVFLGNGTMPGTVCRVTQAGARYRVLFEGLANCLAVPHGGLRRAPAGTQGPACTEDC